MLEATSKTRLYNIYSGMKQRCYNPKNSHYGTYGARGITICNEWLGDNGVQNFISWALDNGYNETLTIDRIDNDKDYSPYNCQWVTASYNSMKGNSEISSFKNGVANKIKALLQIKGKKKNELAEYLGMNSQSLSNKFSRDSFSAEDLIKISDFLDCSLVFEIDDKQKIVLDMADIKRG